MLADLRAVDLFAGAGGATCGLVAAGLEVVAAVDFDAAACATHRAAHPSVPVTEADLSTLDPWALPRGGCVVGEPAPRRWYRQRRSRAQGIAPNGRAAGKTWGRSAWTVRPTSRSSGRDADD